MEILATIKLQAKVTGRGTPLVLVPGGLAGWLSWDLHEERLSQTRRVVRVQPIHVQYEHEHRALPLSYSVKMESETLAATLAGLGFKMPLDVVAWSHGGLVAMDYALDHPDRVRSLTLVEPLAFWLLRALEEVDEEAREFEAKLRSISGEVSEKHLEWFVCAIGLCPRGKSPREMPQWLHWVRHRQALHTALAIFEHADDPARVRNFRRPVLLVKGADSARFLHKIIDLLAMQFPKAQVLELPGGHAAHVTSMELFLERLAVFQKSA